MNTSAVETTREANGFEFPNEIDGEMSFLSGVGHQIDKDRRALNACGHSLQEAFGHLFSIPHNKDVKQLAADINELIVRCGELSYSADQAVNERL